MGGWQWGWGIGMGPRMREDNGRGSRGRAVREQAPMWEWSHERDDRRASHREPVSETGWCLMVGTLGWPGRLKSEAQE